MSESSALDDFEKVFEGKRLPNSAPSDNPICDLCDTPLEPGDRISQFFADRLCHHGPDDATEQWYAARVHCPDCRPDGLVLSPQGFTEFIVVADLQRNLILQNPEVIAMSPATDGPDYDPAGLYEYINGLPFERFMEVAWETEDRTWGLSPQDMMYQFISESIDPQEALERYQEAGN